LPKKIHETISELHFGQTSSVELVTRFIGDVADTHSIFISLANDQLLNDAEQSDLRRKRGETLSELDGVLFAVKDNIDVAGFKTTVGSRTRQHTAPIASDATVVANMRRLGMLPVGKTNMSEFAFSGLGLNPHFGTPALEKAIPDRAPGGSSSGSAIAVAEGLVPAALGTDTAGSTRIPAAFNGLIGFRSSVGRYPMKGVVPLAPTFDRLGAICRSVRDLQIVDFAMRGANVESPSSTDSYFLVDPQFVSATDVEPNVAESYLNFISNLKEGGLPVRLQELPSILKAYHAIQNLGWLGGYEAYLQFKDVIEGPLRESIDVRVVKRLEKSALMSGDQKVRLELLRCELMQSLKKELSGGIVIIPTVKMVAPLLLPLLQDDDCFARTNANVLSLTMIGSFLDMAVVSIPCGKTRDEMQTSISFMATSGRDDTLLAAVRKVEDTIPKL
jgi:aspartyl-tRNA(Asn)/glutamyl-tRNA(Gln) amidotransferase subunit A